MLPVSAILIVLIVGGPAIVVVERDVGGALSNLDEQTIAGFPLDQETSAIVIHQWGRGSIPMLLPPIGLEKVSNSWWLAPQH